MKETPQQRSDVEMLEEETQPHSLSEDYVHVMEDEADEDFEGNCLSKAVLKWENICLLFFNLIYLLKSDLCFFFEAPLL